MSYYLIAIHCARRFFLQPRTTEKDFTPPVSILKPVRGVDREAYANFASFCRQDYSDYEILFGVGDADDPAIPVIQQLIQHFPEQSIRLIVDPAHPGSNNKVSKLCRLAREAQHEVLVVSDSDVRVRPDYLRAVLRPFRDPRVGAVTCMYPAIAGNTLGDEVEAISLATNFFASVLVARELEGVKFALGATMATTRSALAEIGGFEAIADCFSDDFELGNRIAAKGYRVELVPDTVKIVLPSQGLLGCLRHQLRCAVGVRNSRPWGHFGLILTQGLPWSLAAMALARSAGLAACILGAYLALRLTMAWTVGVWGLQDPLLPRKLWLVPVVDGVDFFIWLASFWRNRVEWRGADFYVREGRLIPIGTLARDG